MDGGASMPARRRRGAGWHDVVVVGGGMAGAAAALALARGGLDVALVEARQPRPWSAHDAVDLRVVALAPSSADLLDALGVWADISHARAQAYRHMHVWDAESGAVLDMDACHAGRAAMGWIVENRLVQHLLWEALEAGGVPCRCPAEVVALDAQDDHVAVRLADATALKARVLVAADGSASPLRGMVGLRTTGHDYRQRAVVAHIATERGHADTAWQRFLPGGPVALLPLADGRCSLVWSLPEAAARDVMVMDDDAFCEAVGVASDLRLGRVTATSKRASFPLQLQLAQAYRVGRVVLLGDAAHTVHPLAGQGINLGLRDVAELRDVLVGAHEAGRDVGGERVLQAYARRRHSANAVDAWSLDALARIYAWQVPPLVAVRGLGMRIVDHLPPLKRALVRHAAGLAAGYGRGRVDG